MPRYFQVNQRYANLHEFISEYLCAPNTGLPHHAALKSLQIGDYILHYYSGRRAIFGVSIVIALGPHKAGGQGAQAGVAGICRIYNGPHLSLREMDRSMALRERSRRPQTYLEVHVSKVIQQDLGPNFFPKQRIYCQEIPASMIAPRKRQFPSIP
jgi:hypothetical protein